MFARNVNFQVKTGMEKDFLKVMNADVLPLLKTQDGFREELTLVTGDRGLGISVWNDKVSAEKYATTVFPDVLKKLTPYLTAAPKVDLCEVGATTLH